MARLFPNDIGTRPSGKLLFEEVHPNYNEVYYIPPDVALAEAGLDPAKAESYKKGILDINGQNDYVTIIPINTLPTHKDFLQGKYADLLSITLDGFGYGGAKTEDEVIDLLENLPSCFVKDYDYGLGLRKDYRFIVDILEDLNIQTLVISKKDSTSIDEKGTICTIKYSDFEQIRKTIDRITREARQVSSEVKKISAHNVLAFFLEDETKYPHKDIRKQDGTLARLIAKSSPVLPVHLSKVEQSAAIDLVSSNKSKMAKDQPEALVKLRNDIDLVTLEKLVQTYEEMLAKKLSEDRWQALFNENPFILNMAFGCPIIKIQDQAYVGGRKISGSGEKIADFLVKNSLSNNAALIEIKTPSTSLLNKTSYRDGVYVASKDLSGSLNQVLDQRLKFQQNIFAIKNNSKLYAMETYHVQGFLIVGTMPTEDDKIKSFELFRGNSKDITIITFDELLEKLKHLHAFLSPNLMEKN
ncbi:MAG: hypothetical protein CBB87_06055 [Micavibrio sp. TMED27]|mgnify:CR=1 FL=1|nr:hypothetical protein [Micavibrio sp.]OUT91576.1 MAG: hypothetical protein CBB87_06055 [Micavibrio sp. TMED27]|tara:strand:- start:4130 stop:5539 length:1410 start_codon:yes stop_codon:yes gene_type:complete